MAQHNENIKRSLSHSDLRTLQNAGVYRLRKELTHRFRMNQATHCVQASAQASARTSAQASFALQKKSVARTSATIRVVPEYVAYKYLGLFNGPLNSSTYVRILYRSIVRSSASTTHSSLSYTLLLSRIAGGAAAGSVSCLPPTTSAAGISIDVGGNIFAISTPDLRHLSETYLGLSKKPKAGSVLLPTETTQEAKKLVTLALIRILRKK